MLSLTGQKIDNNLVSWSTMWIAEKHFNEFDVPLGRAVGKETTLKLSVP
jgi:hypothetical protein